MTQMASKLVKKDAAGNVTRWGVMVPSTGYAYWMFQAFARQNGQDLMNRDGNQTNYAHPDVIAALQYWRDLGVKHKVMPEGTVEWGTLRQAFTEGKTAMMWHTTGNLTAVKDSAKFPFGVAMLPASKQRGSPTGGGNFYLFKKTTPEERKAALAFVKWMTAPERAADWSMATGYVATRPDAYDDAEAEGVRGGLPAGGRCARPVRVRHARAVDVPDRARAQAARRRDPGVADRAEVAGGRAEARRRRRRTSFSSRTAEGGPMKHVYGWLLLTPAAILLIGFTHYPASPPSSTASSPPGRWCGRPGSSASTTTPRSLDDPIFWQVLGNNAWFALGTIPTSIAIAMVMALWVNDKLPARALVRMSVLHADHAADDRGGEPVAVLLHAPDRNVRPGRRAVRRAEPQLARRPEPSCCRRRW